MEKLARFFGFEVRLESIFENGLQKGVKKSPLATWKEIRPKAAIFIDYMQEEVPWTIAKQLNGFFMNI